MQSCNSSANSNEGLTARFTLQKRKEKENIVFMHDSSVTSICLELCHSYSLHCRFYKSLILSLVNYFAILQTTHTKAHTICTLFTNRQDRSRETLGTTFNSHYFSIIYQWKILLRLSFLENFLTDREISLFQSSTTLALNGFEQCAFWDRLVGSKCSLKLFVRAQCQNFCNISFICSPLILTSLQ